MKKLVLSFVLILILVFIGLSVFNKTILRSNSTGFLRTIIILFFPPRELYAHLVMKEIKFQVNSSAFVLEFEHKYIGKHSLNLLLFNKDRSISYLNDKKITGTVKCSLDKNVKLNEKLRLSQPFIWKKGTGMTLLSYRVPEKLPLNGDVVCEVSFSNFDRSLSNMNAMLVINKDSEL